MKANYQSAAPGFEAASENHDLQIQPEPIGLSAGRLLGWVGLNIKRLLVVGMLALSLSAFAGNPTATDMGRFIKFVGKQAVNSAVEDDDIAYIRKSAIIRYESSKQQVNITLTAGNMAFAFETKEAARAFVAQIAEYCAKEQ
jgi:hypothetical protein